VRTERRWLPLPPTDIVTVLVCTAVVFVSLAFGGKALESYRLQRQAAALREQIAALEEEGKALEAHLRYVQTPEYVEKVAREQYKWAKAGEKMIITIFRRSPAAEAAPTPVPMGMFGGGADAAVSHWPEWLGLLTGSFD
jgi:cell division protein FtsB